MHKPQDLAAQFRALHVAGNPLVLFNVWDAGSANAVAASGAQAVATGSWSVAAANGYKDGEQVPFDLAMANLGRIVRAIELPVSVDIESGYDDVPAAITRSIQAGAIGCNIEDSFPADGSLRSIAEHAARLRQARAAADLLNVQFFINARTDVFFQAGPEAHNIAMIDAALERAHAYAAAGANGIFVPGLVDESLIARMAAASPLPVNVMVMEQTPSLARLAAAGVARVSHGPGPYLSMMRQLTEAARLAGAK